MLPDVPAGQPQASGLLIRPAPGSAGDGTVGLIHGLCPRGLKGSLWTTLCKNRPG